MIYEYPIIHHALHAMLCGTWKIFVHLFCECNLKSVNLVLKGEAPAEASTTETAEEPKTEATEAAPESAPAEEPAKDTPVAEDKKEESKTE